jgi:RNA polymerase sigma factor (TIGR02999 family)
MAGGQETGDGQQTAGEITLLLGAARTGDGTAIARICELLYHDLRRIARNRLRAHEPQTLLNTTALVHESFFRLVKVGRVELADRNHFLRYAARAMRSAVIDVVRQKRTERFGGDVQYVTLDTAMVDTIGNREDEVIRLGDAIEQLMAVDDRAMQVVEMRYFAGMTELEIAEALGVTERTVRRDWQKARLLLKAAME